MSSDIDAREVLAYLNELGYRNISAPQLKEFLKDLKKVIKYDLRYGLSEQPPTGSEESYCECSSNDSPMEENDKENAVVNPNVLRDKHISVHIFDTKKRQMLNHDHCVHFDSIKPKTGTEATVSVRPESSESTIKTVPPCSSNDLIEGKCSRTSSKKRTSRVTFIRPTISKPQVNKSDPVALYHYYQSEWKKTKIPGQDSRDDLRWAIREKMLSGPRVEVKSKCSIQKCSWDR